eukprot:scaffold103433_cov50-Prasinocladus_malaysianus.AAC.1
MSPTSAGSASNNDCPSARIIRTAAFGPPPTFTRHKETGAATHQGGCDSRRPGTPSLKTTDALMLDMMPPTCLVLD